MYHMQEGKYSDKTTNIGGIDGHQVPRNFRFILIIQIPSSYKRGVKPWIIKHENQIVHLSPLMSWTHYKLTSEML